MELDTLAAETSAMMTTDHPDYATLAARIAVSNLHKETKKQFSGKFDVVSVVFINYMNVTINNYPGMISVIFSSYCDTIY